jgi:RimJ/RimL family protein N-acetyltransferase
MSDDLETAYPRQLSGAAVKNLPSGLVPARSAIEGKAIRLEPLNPALHAAELYQASHGDAEALRIWDYLPYGPWPDAASFAAWLRDRAASFDPIFYAIRAHGGGRACGVASFMDMHPQNGVIEIGGIWFGRALQRTRGATEALYLMLRHAMSDLGYRRMQWRCNALNVKSRNAARRLGFRFEGVFYNHLIFKGMNRDTAWFSILDDEWPEVDAIITTWLADDNFAADGTARRSLAEMMKDRTPSRRA